MLRRLPTKMLRKKLKLEPIAKLSNETEANHVTASEISSENVNKQQPTQQREAHNNGLQNDDIAQKMLQLELDLSESLKPLKFKTPVAYVYNPLEYAFKPHSVFTNKYCTTQKQILFVGMNPGPWGMCQTGVPFGEINAVREWFNIKEEVSRPEKECPDRRIVGFACSKSEVSGKRLWGLFKQICVTPENFFKSAYMYNYCPLAFMKDGGGNVTPDGIKGPVQKELLSLCDNTLFKIIQLLDIKVLVGVGRFTEKRATDVLKKNEYTYTKVIYLPHPSPLAFPGDTGDTKWLEKTEKILKEENLLEYLIAN